MRRRSDMNKPTPEQFGLGSQQYTHLVAERARLREIIDRQSRYGPWIFELAKIAAKALIFIPYLAMLAGSVGFVVGMIVGAFLGLAIRLAGIEADQVDIAGGVVGAVFAGGCGITVFAEWAYKDAKRIHEEIGQRGQCQKQLSAPEYREVELYEAAVSKWNLTQQQHWKSLRGVKFESALARLYRNMGYLVRQTKGSGDEGIDLVLLKEGIETVVQCKGHAKPVGVGAVRDLYGAMMHFGATGAILACPAGFTKGVTEFVTNKPIQLVSANELAEMAGSAHQKRT